MRTSLIRYGFECVSNFHGQLTSTNLKHTTSAIQHYECEPASFSSKKEALQSVLLIKTNVCKSRQK